MAKFAWGKELERFEYDFDGEQVEVVKYLPRKYVDGIAVPGEFESAPSFHIAALSRSFCSLDAALIGHIANKRLGLNQHALVDGVCRALAIY